MNARNERAMLVQERQAVHVKGERRRLRKLEEGKSEKRRQREACWLQYN